MNEQGNDTTLDDLDVGKNPRRDLVIISPDDIAQKRDAWLADRRTAITATDAAMILGLSKFGGPMDVFLDKTGQGIEKEVSGPMEWGRRLERPILIAYADAIGGGIAFRDSYELTRSKLFPLIGATLDAVRLDDGRPVDAKNVRFPSAEWGESGTDKIPLYYACQLYVQMFVEEKDVADLAVLFGGQDFRIYTLHRNEETMTAIVDRCLAFWLAHVETLTPPPVDGSKAYAEYLGKTLIQTKEVVLEADAALNDVAEKLGVALDEKVEVEGRIETYRSTLKAAIGEAKGIEGRSFRATWSTSKGRASTNFEAAFSELVRQYATPRERVDEVIAKYSTTGPGSRSFRFTLKQGG